MLKCLVIGSGITGLASAYAAVKQGYVVTIVDKDLGISGSTAQQHGWFHAGHLYLMLDDISIYESFKNNKELIKNLNCDFDITDQKLPWFANENIEYHIHATTCREYADNDWTAKLDQLKTRLGANIELSESAIFNDAFKYTSADQVMNTEKIISDLLNFLMARNVKFMQKNVENFNEVIINRSFSGKSYDKIILAIASGFNTIPDVNSTTKFSILGVSDEWIADQSLVYMHPDYKKTLNCLNHIDQFGDQISVIGDGVNFDVAPNKTDFYEFEEKVRKNFGVKLNKFIVGSKTEIVDSQKRNYKVNIKKLNKDVIAISAGKFSNFPTIIKEVHEYLADWNKSHAVIWHPYHKRKL